MIGLMQMIRARLRSEMGFSDGWQPQSRFCLSRREPWAYPLSRRYYQLLDACSLRMSGPPSPQSEVQK